MGLIIKNRTFLSGITVSSFNALSFSFDGFAVVAFLATFLSVRRASSFKTTVFTSSSFERSTIFGEVDEALVVVAEENDGEVGDGVSSDTLGDA